ncbi:hypothetical protein K7432_005779 [Basidiobolus ranarum]|uniref:Uncharacterized protein n=1 Tax=Basidiobolus ranarum TaxID=34480 RepID=A0ABR2WW46_9FUNG
MSAIASTPNRKRTVDALNSPSSPLEKPSFFSSLFGRASKEFTELCSSISNILYVPTTLNSTATPKLVENSQACGKQRKSRSSRPSRKFATPVTKDRRLPSRSRHSPRQKSPKHSPSVIDIPAKISEDKYLNELLSMEGTSSPGDSPTYSSTPQYSPKYTTEPEVIIPVRSDRSRLNTRKRRRICEHSPICDLDGVSKSSQLNESISPSFGSDLSFNSPTSKDVSPNTPDWVKRRESSQLHSNGILYSPSKGGKIAKLEEELQSLKEQVASLRQVMDEKEQDSSSASSSPASKPISSLLPMPPPPPPPPPPTMVQLGPEYFNIKLKTSDGILKQSTTETKKEKNDRMMMMLEEMRTVKLRRTGRL